ncbi:protein NTM1-like 9 isoform X1 [Quercus robur]|uniref:protein NTM1-like 9 isoform X1 n=1 Tax=Quercus robur TaxID=38942 RepID=UPI002161244A|nr:protein NTM1-like 9 isoform X1 [Quercus robur]XP_050252098.1 protein NTM1-like 9 isoform X1 [Quercus robur]
MEKLSLDHLPPGVRFSPKDKEVIELYLKKKITGNDKDIWFIPEIEFYKDEPWDLPSKSRIATEDQEWFFFNEQSLKHQDDNPKKRKRDPKQERVNRKTKAGFWKSTGTDREIKSGESLIGMKKTLVFHMGTTKGKEKGKGTKWVVHEYSTTQKDFDGKHPGQKAFVLYRLFNNREKSTNGGPAASLDTSSRIEEMKSKSSLAPVSPALDVQAETHQTSNQSCYAKIPDEMLSDATAPVPCENASVAEKQEAEMTSSEDEFNVEEFLNNLFPSTFNFYVDEMMSDATAPIQFKNGNFNSEVDQDLEKAPKMFYPHPPEPLDCNFSSISTITTATPAVSSPTTAKASLEEAQSMLAPASVCEADNYPMSFQCYPAENYDGISSSSIPPIKYIGYNTCVAKNDVVEKTSDEMQADDCFCYKSSSQNNLTFDDETQENMVSAQINWSSENLSCIVIMCNSLIKSIKICCGLKISSKVQRFHQGCKNQDHI